MHPAKTLLHVVTQISTQFIHAYTVHVQIQVGYNRYIVPLTSILTALACRARVAREYSNTCVYSREYTRVLEHAHAGTHASTCEYLNACTKFTRSGHASLVPKPSTFFRGGRGLGIDAIDTHLRVLCALVTHARTHVLEYSHASSEGVTRMRLSSHSRVDRQVARERHCRHVYQQG